MTRRLTSTDKEYGTLGAIVDDGATQVRVWAPGRRSVEVVRFATDDVVQRHPLRHDGDGYWSAHLAGFPAGTLYKFRLDGRDEETFPDPASRFQPFGVHGPSAVIDPSLFRWSDHTWSAPPFSALSIYELHIGTFTPEGTFRAAAAQLPALVELGVTAIELMPVADFPGDRNWGYDGVALFAPARCYGTPDDLRALIDAAHRYGLAVILDVVYNHLGPDGAYANAFSPYYFTDAHESPWGRGVNLDGAHSEHVRRAFIDNAIHWVTEYHLDGLRLDATHALIDEGPRHFLAELAATVRARSDRNMYLIAEDHRNLATLLRPPHEGGYGLDAVWADDFHHLLRVHTARDDEGYYADFTGSTEDIARTLERGWFFDGQYSPYQGHPRGTDPAGLDPSQFVICIQNHDQVGNRADGSRLNHEIDPAAYRALSALLLLAPQTPMLFMGQEWAASTPFLYFTDHHAELGRQVTEGRRREFQSFAAFAEPDSRHRIPDPQARETFERSRLNWAEIADAPHAGVRELYRRLLAFRQSALVPQLRARGTFTATAVDEHTVTIDYGGRLIVIVRLSGGAGEVTVTLPPGMAACLSTEVAGTSEHPRPIAIHRGHEHSVVRFARPGAVVFSATEQG